MGLLFDVGWFDSEGDGDLIGHIKLYEGAWTMREAVILLVTLHWTRLVGR